ncbi:MAG: ABC transporter substrate-binding protein [Anaerorhabdus sp.]
MKKLFKVLLVMIMALSVIGCSKKEEPEVKEGDKVTIWAWDETFNIAALKDAAAMYKEINPDVEIEIVTMNQDDVVQKLHINLSSGKLDGLPDVVLIDDYRCQNFLTAYSGSFAEVGDIVNENDFASYKFGSNKIDGKLYGIPFDSGVTGLFYRTDYIEEAGYTQEDMKNLTWEKYIEIGKAVKEKTGKDMLTLDPSDVGQLRIMMQSAGTWYMNEDGQTVNIENNQVLKDGIEIYKSMIDSEIVKQVSDWDSFVSAFQQGDVASVPSGCWILSSITAAEDLAGKWALTEIPRLGNNADSTNYSNFGGSGWYILNNDNVEVTKAFMKETFASSADLMNTLANNIGVVSTLKAAKDTESYAAGNPFFNGQPTFKMFSEWAEKIKGVNYGLHTYEIEDIVEGAVQAILGGTEIDAALKDAHAQAQSAVSK